MNQKRGTPNEKPAIGGPDHTAFVSRHRSLVDRLHARAIAARPGLAGRVSADVLGEALSRSVAHRFGDETPTPAEVASYLESLHVGDLALACACAEGHEAAWEQFITEVRPTLYAAARALARHDDTGRELADSIYAELYGLETDRAPGGIRRGRRSLFRYFHGRSKLTTWLRAILAQRHVDAVRAGRRFEPLGTGDGGGRRVPDPSSTPSEPDPDRARYLSLMQAALTAALNQLDDRDRMRLSCYYIQAMTLAEIGRLLGEHEATVSRKLDRIRRRLREAVERELTEVSRFTADEIRLCYQYALEDLPFDLKEQLEGEVQSS